MRFVVPDDYPPIYGGHTEALDRLRERGELAFYDSAPGSVDELVNRLRGAAAVVNVRMATPFDARTLDRLPDLRLISVVATGIENVELEAATARGVIVSNVPGTSTVSVAELTFGLLLAVARRLAFADRELRRGAWTTPPGLELRGKTLGLVGLGLIGQEVARLAAAFGMRLLSWSLRNEPARAAALGAETVELDELCRRADVLSVHLRASPLSRNIIGRRELALMKPTAILINTARGALVDLDALVEALRERRIFGAGLDVYPEEPLPPGSPLLELDNVVLAPHVGWLTDAAGDRLRHGAVENVLGWLDGRPQNVCNPAVLEGR
jgi:phosphoglycerate dehydrogenase-like enzyme